VSGCSLSPVAEFGNAFLLRAVSTAEDPAVRLDSVSDHTAATVSADRRERVNRTLEAVERVRVACAHDLERLVVVVTAYLADGHLLLLSYPAGLALRRFPFAPGRQTSRAGPVFATFGY
jgi:hypothetical protein